MSSNRILIIILILLFASSVQALRVPRPNTFQLPWDEAQMSQHNDAHEDMWNISNGEFNLDIVTTTKTNANNGDFWMIQTGSTVRIQYKAAGQIFTVTPDGF